MLTTTDQRQTTESNKDELMNLLERLHMDVQKGLKTVLNLIGNFDRYFCIL